MADYTGVIGCFVYLRRLRNNIFASSHSAMQSPYPEIQGGASLILAWQVRSKHVLVIGGGEVSAPVLWVIQTRID